MHKFLLEHRHDIPVHIYLPRKGAYAQVVCDPQTTCAYLFAEEGYLCTWGG